VFAGTSSPSKNKIVADQRPSSSNFTPFKLEISYLTRINFISYLFNLPPSLTFYLPTTTTTIYNNNHRHSIKAS
jgi:hypothetical protein